MFKLGLKLSVWHACGMLLAFSLTSVARADGAPSLNWQRQDLEQKIKADLSEVLTGVVGAGHFAVTVDIHYRKPNAPVVAVAPPVPVAKSDDKAPAADSKEDGDREFFLSKLGISSTAVFAEATPSAAMAAADTPDSQDIFSLLEQIKVLCMVDTSIDDARIEVVKKVIANQLKPYAPSKNEIAIDRAKLFTPAKIEPTAESERKPATDDDKEEAAPAEKPAEKTIVEKDMGEKFEPFKLPVTVFLSFLTVMAMMFMLFRANKPSASAAAPAPEAKPELAAEVSAPTATHEPVPAAALTSASAPAFESPELRLTVEKFKIFIQTSERQARRLLQDWVNRESPLTVGALKALAMHLSLAEFRAATSDFDANQRKRLRQVMTSDSAAVAPVAQVMEFVSAQVMSSVLVEDSEVSEAQKSFLSSLKSTEVVQLAQVEPELAGGLLNLLPGELVAQIFNSLDAATVDQVLKVSLLRKPADVIAKFATVEGKVKEIREHAKVTLMPVLENVEMLLRQVSPDKEGSLYSALLASKAYAMVADLSRRYFPSDLVLQLEPSKLNAVLLRMPLTKRAELIFSLDEADRATILKALGESGKMRELIDSEIEGIATDAARKKSIELGRDLIWRQFVGQVREAVQTNPLLQDNAEAVLKVWIDTKKAELNAAV